MGIPDDLKAAARHLIGQPLYAAAAAVTLSLAVGANVLMLDTVDRLLLRPPAEVAEPERVVRFYFNFGPGTSFGSVTNPVVAEDFEQRLGAYVESVATYSSETLSLGRGPEARKLNVVDYSPRRPGPST